MNHWKVSTALTSLGILLMASSAHATEVDPSSLLNLSLEQLSNIEITSVSKRAEKASEAAAAIFVITPDDIRRSGATSIPEVLRMVPGLNVAQAGSHQWAITARGFNDQFANKLLVLIDGRSVYTPLFSGVYWDVQDTMMEDIERIEVIRGPGATLWGANAVNGVINIITKHARSTQGSIVNASVGTLENALVSARYGYQINENAFMRVYGKYDDHDSFRTMTDADAQDEWNKGQVGFRTDWKNSDKHSFTVQGDLYRAGESGKLNLPTLTTPFTNTVQDRERDSGGNILGRWNYELSSASELTVQLYYDNLQRKNIVLTDKQETFDFDFQHAWNPIERHEVVWGGGYRLVKDKVFSALYAQFNPQNRSDNLFSAFVQDKIEILTDTFYVTLGSKFERNDYTGFEFQPSARVTWLIDDDQTLWGSVSRAVRTPNRAAEDSTLLLLPTTVIGPGIDGFLARVGSKNNESEDLNAYEIGYRNQITPDVSLDIAAFYNDYRSLVLGTLGTPYLDPTSSFFIVPVYPANVGTAYSWGVEPVIKWDATDYCQLAAGYSLLRLKFEQGDPFGFSFAGKTPEHQFNVRSALQLPHNIEVNHAIYYVDNLEGLGIEKYTRVDMRVAWKPIDSIELSVVGQNLLDSAHQEFTGFTYQNNSQIPRSFYANITWKF